LLGSEEYTKSREIWSLNCAKCGKCIQICPTYKVTRWEHLSPRGRLILSPYVEDDRELVKSIFSCLTCGICEQVCPSNVEITEIIEKKRGEYAKQTILPERHVRLLNNMVEKGNPYGDDIETMEIDGEVDVIYYPGCTSLAREREIFESTVKILKSMGVSFGIEFMYCCGSTSLRIGGDLSYAERNYRRLREVVERTKAKTLLVNCPGCYRTVKKDYEKFGGLGVRIMHITEFLSENAEMLRLRKDGIRVSFHDSCHLARHMGIVKEPRRVLSMVSEIVEPEQHGMESFCCGGGGGVRVSYRELTREVRKVRIEQFRRTNADVVVTSCPYCYRNLKNGADGLIIKDLTSFIAERLEE